jgi:hypothetical protein
MALRTDAVQRAVTEAIVTAVRPEDVYPARLISFRICLSVCHAIIP